jgi:hypothetical protein
VRALDGGRSSSYCRTPHLRHAETTSSRRDELSIVAGFGARQLGIARRRTLAPLLQLPPHHLPDSQRVQIWLNQEADRACLASTEHDACTARSLADPESAISAARADINAWSEPDGELTRLDTPSAVRLAGSRAMLVRPANAALAAPISRSRTGWAIYTGRHSQASSGPALSPPPRVSGQPSTGGSADRAAGPGDSCTAPGEKVGSGPQLLAAVGNPGLEAE